MLDFCPPQLPNLPNPSCSGRSPTPHWRSHGVARSTPTSMTLTCSGYLETGCPSSTRTIAVPLAVASSGACSRGGYTPSASAASVAPWVGLQWARPRPPTAQPFTAASGLVGGSTFASKFLRRQDSQIQTPSESKKSNFS